MKRLLARALCAAAIGFAMHGAARADDAITVGVVASQAGAPVYLAQALGFFKAEGLDAKIVQFNAAGSIATAAAAGDVDFGSTATTAALCVFANEGKVRIIGSGGGDHRGFHTIGMVASNAAYANGLRGFGDLKGHSIAITQYGTALQYLIALILRKYGLPENSVRYVALQSNGNIASSIAGGEVDSAIMTTANVYQLVNPGKAKIIGWVGDVVNAEQGDVTFTTGQMDRSHPDIVRRFLAAFGKGAAAWDAAFLDRNGNRKDEADAPKVIGIVAKAINQPPAVVGNGIGYFDPEGRLSLPAFQDMLDWFLAQGMIKTRMDAASLVDEKLAALRN